jgi:hypothetical protein
MKMYKVNGNDYKVFEPEDMIPEGTVILSDWRKGHVGDWVKADDDCVIQILRRGRMLRAKGKDRVREYVGTCTGTFPISKTVKMDTSRRINIYSFGGNKKADDILLDRARLTKHEHLFVVYICKGMALKDAYMRAFPTKNARYAEHKSAQLIKTERVRTAMKEELKPVMEELGIDEKIVLEGIKSEAFGADKADTRLKALFKLSDILDLEDKNRTTVTQMAIGAFKGFSPEELDAAKPKELESDLESE